jgi:uncharacterized surface protein with fasciclin (FAS1) repeats
VKTSSFNQPTVNSEAPTFFFVFFESIPSFWAKALIETGSHQRAPINKQTNKQTKNSMKSLIKKLAFALSIAALSGASLNAAEEKNIVETAVSAGSFKTLTAALTAAGLVDALKGNGPFTVFAPTDEAFAKLPPGTVENLLKLKPENKAMLIDILTYHVVRGNVPSGTAIKLTEATALDNKKIKLEVKEGSLFLNTAKVTTADVKCSNGVIHIIDAVLMPLSTDKMVN